MDEKTKSLVAAELAAALIQTPDCFVVPSGISAEVAAAQLFYRCFEALTIAAPRVRPIRISQETLREASKRQRR
jgi:hypothetical protein